MRDQRIDERSAQISSAGMNHEPRRLIDHDEIVIFKEDAIRRQFEFPISRGQVLEKLHGIDVCLDRHARLQRHRCELRPPSIYENGSRHDQFSHFCFGDRTAQGSGQPFGEGRIQPFFRLAGRCNESDLLDGHRILTNTS